MKLYRTEVIYILKYDGGGICAFLNMQDLYRICGYGQGLNLPFNEEDYENS